MNIPCPLIVTPLPPTYVLELASVIFAVRTTYAPLFKTAFANANSVPANVTLKQATLFVASLYLPASQLMQLEAGTVTGKNVPAAHVVHAVERTLE